LKRQTKDAKPTPLLQDSVVGFQKVFENTNYPNRKGQSLRYFADQIYATLLSNFFKANGVKVNFGSKGTGIIETKW